MVGAEKDISALIRDHQAPTPEPTEEPVLPERLPDPLEDEPPVPDHNPSGVPL